MGGEEEIFGEEWGTAVLEFVGINEHDDNKSTEEGGCGDDSTTEYAREEYEHGSDKYDSVADDIWVVEEVPAVE